MFPPWVVYFLTCLGKGWLLIWDSLHRLMTGRYRPTQATTGQTQTDNIDGPFATSPNLIHGPLSSFHFPILKFRQMAFLTERLSCTISRSDIAPGSALCSIPDVLTKPGHTTFWECCDEVCQQGADLCSRHLYQELALWDTLSNLKDISSRKYHDWAAQGLMALLHSIRFQEGHFSAKQARFISKCVCKGLVPLATLRSWEKPLDLFRFRNNLSHITCLTRISTIYNSLYMLAWIQFFTAPNPFPTLTGG